jgi:hypothetical protein
MRILVVLVILVGALAAGFLASATISARTVTVTTSSAVTETTIESSMITTTMIKTVTTQYQYLTMEQAINRSLSHNIDPYIEMAGCVGQGCTDSENQSIPLAPYGAAGQGHNFVLISDLNGTTGVDAQVTTYTSNSLWLTLENHNSQDETFVIYVDNTTSPIVVYLWWYGNTPPA